MEPTRIVTLCLMVVAFGVAVWSYYLDKKFEKEAIVTSTSIIGKQTTYGRGRSVGGKTRITVEFTSREGKHYVETFYPDLPEAVIWKLQKSVDVVYMNRDPIKIKTLMEYEKDRERGCSVWTMLWFIALLPLGALFFMPVTYYPRNTK